MSKPAIVEQIEEGMELWEKTVGLKPNNCYLGVEQVNAWAHAFDGNEEEGNEILDINIYAVRSKNHLGFGV